MDVYQEVEDSEQKQEAKSEKMVKMPINNKPVAVNTGLNTASRA